MLSGAVLTSIYFVFISNSRQYYTQEQIVQMQESMRFALEYLKNDLRNAGQMALVNGTAVEHRPDLLRPAERQPARGRSDEQHEPAPTPRTSSASLRNAISPIASRILAGRLRRHVDRRAPRRGEHAAS